MASETFSVKNVKCGGCTANIQNGLKDMPGVSTVDAALDGSVTVQGENLDRAALAAKLTELGYPEA